MDEHWPPLPPSVITDPTIRDRCFRAFTRLYLRAWNGNTLSPVRLTEEELCVLLHKSRAQCYSLLAEMTSAKLIRWYRDGPFFRITAAFHAPAPSGDSPPFGGVSVESGNPDSFSSESGFPDSSLEIQTRISESRKVRQVNGAGALKESLIKTDDDDGSLDPHHHQSPARGESGNPDSDVETTVFLNLVREQAEAWLIQAGVWRDEAENIAMTLAENEVLRSYNSHLPTRADILGWIVALKNRDDVQKPDAMLTRNLKYGRRAPVKLRPPLVCGTCQRIEGYCRCAEPTAFGYPDEYIALALDEDATGWACRVCHAVPCACPPEPVSAETPAGRVGASVERGVSTDGETSIVSRPAEGLGWNGIGMAPEFAFQAAINQLQMEMPKATFDTWVRDAKFAGYDHGRISIQFINAYARDWCESRLSTTISRILTGIMNQPVELEFVA